jgi:raffinose/stachyose/melibiose transport system substrate-binding protein
MQPVVALFEKMNPSIKIELEFETANSYIDTLATRLLAGTAPDVFIYTSQNKAALNKGNYVLDLTDAPSTAVMAAANRNFMSSGDKVYGFSPASWSSGAIWNLRLLDKVGGTPPATWADFLEMCAKLKKLGVVPYTDAAQVGTGLEALIGSYWRTQGLLAPGQVLGVKGDQLIFSGKSTFAKEWAVPLAEYNQLYSAGLVPSSVVALTGAEVDSQLANGQLAALGSGPWDVAAVQLENPKLAMKMLPIPGAKAGEDFWCGAPNEGWAVYSKSKVIDAALEFIDFLASPEGLKIYAKNSGDIITTTNYASPVPSSLTECAVAARSSNYYFTGISWPNAYSQAMGTVAIADIEIMIQGKMNPGQVLRAMDAEVKRLTGK